MLDAYHPFFGACAAVAGTLIGLLFVAISVSPHKDVGRDAPLSFQVQAAAAFMALVDALVVALIALLPSNNFSFGATAVALASVGISSTIGMAILAIRHWPGRRHLWGLVIIPVLGAVFGLQLANGIAMANRPSDTDVHLQALLLIALFVIATARAWQMIGVEDTRMSTLVGELVRERHDPPRNVVPDRTPCGPTGPLERPVTGAAPLPYEHETRERAG